MARAVTSGASRLDRDNSVELAICRAVVHHGGSGTTAAGMRAGVPALILWSTSDQPIWAAQVRQLKVGAAHRFSSTTLESLVAGLRRILAPQYGIRARDLEKLDSLHELVNCAGRGLERKGGWCVAQGERGKPYRWRLPGTPGDR